MPAFLCAVILATYLSAWQSLPMMKPTRMDIPETADAVAGLEQSDVSAALEMYQRQLEKALAARDYERMVRVGQILVQLGRSRSDHNASKTRARMTVAASNDGP